MSNVRAYFRDHDGNFIMSLNAADFRSVQIINPKRGYIIDTALHFLDKDTGIRWVIPMCSDAILEHMRNIAKNEWVDLGEAGAAVRFDCMIIMDSEYQKKVLAQLKRSAEVLWVEYVKSHSYLSV